MENNCGNCHDKDLCDEGCINRCENFEHWQPNYQTLEIQLQKANGLIKEQIEDIAIRNEALKLACFTVSLCSNKNDKYWFAFYINQAKSNQEAIK